MFQRAERANTALGVSRCVSAAMAAVVTLAQDTVPAHRAGWGPPVARRMVSAEAYYLDIAYSFN